MTEGAHQDQPQTPPPSPPPDDGEADLGVRYAHQLNLLLNMVRLSRMGGIATVECDSIALRKQLFHHLERCFHTLNIYLYPVEVSRTDLNLVRVLRDLTDRTGFKHLELVGRYQGIVLFIYGIEQYSEVEKGKFLQFLNLFRDATTIIKQPIVLWATSDFIQQMAREAPDFWSWKGLTICFETERAETSPDADLLPLQRYVRSLAENPDFAVWRDLYVPLRGSLMQLAPPLAEGLMMRSELWAEALPTGRRWQGEGDEPGWQRVRTTDLLELLASHATGRSMVVGGAGAGKTTVLRYLAGVHARSLFVAAKHKGSAAFQSLIPVYVKLNQLKLKHHLERLIFDALQQHQLAELTDLEELEEVLFGEGVPAGWAERAPRFLLLLDGLNEMPGEYTQALEHFLARLEQRHAVIVTCRPESSSPLEHFQLVMIEPLDQEDMERYAIRYLGTQRGRLLAAEIRQDPLLQELACNPLGLFMLTEMSSERAAVEALPRNRGVLFQEFTESLLRRTETEWWRVFGRAKAKVTLEISREALSQLGLTMQRERLTSVDRERAYWLIRETVFGTAINASARDIFEGLLFSGLIRLSGDREHVEFIHQAVREYCAAVRLLGDEEQLGWYLDDGQQRGEWVGTTVLLFGLTPSRANLYREIVRKGQDYWRLWLAAECLANIRLDGEGWAELDEALAPDEREAALFQLVCGLVYESRGEFPEALAHFRQAVVLDPTQPFAYYDLGVVFRRLGMYQHAVAALRQAIALVPGFVDAYNQLGISYYEAGDLTRALLVFASTVELEPENHHHYYNVGFVHKSLNQYAQARHAFYQALLVKPDYEEARTQLELLEEAQQSSLLSRLDSILLFQSLPLEQRVQLVKGLRPRQYQSAEIILAEGEQGDEFFLIEEGEVEVWTTDAEGRRVVLNRLGPNDHFGEIALLEDRPRRTASVSALTPLHLLVLHRESFAVLQGEWTDVAENLVQTSYERLQRHRASSRG